VPIGGTPSAGPADPPEAHTTQAAPPEASVRWKFDVAIGRCAKPDSCPLEVRLLKDGTLVDTLAVAEVDNSHGGGPEAVEPSWGAGDPLLGEPTRRAHRYGDREQGISVLTREVTLPGAEKALLVTQRGGSEQVHHKNDLFVVTGGRLTRAWSKEEGAGPRWTSVATVPRPGGADALVLFEGFLHPDPNEPETLSAHALTWDGQQRTIVERAQVSVAAPVYAAVVGRYADVPAARKAREGKLECLARFWLLPLDQIPGAGSGGYTFAAMSTRRDLAQAALESAKRCLSAPWSTLVELP
jgi:hypothetical protein